MTTIKLGAFALVLAAIFGGALGAGRLTGAQSPVPGTATARPAHTGH